MKLWNVSRILSCELSSELQIDLSFTMAGQLNSRLAAFVALLFFLAITSCNGKETMGERAQAVRERRSQMAASQRAPLQTRDEPKYRYLTNKTEGMFFMRSIDPALANIFIKPIKSHLCLMLQTIQARCMLARSPLAMMILSRCSLSSSQNSVILLTR